MSIEGPLNLHPPALQPHADEADDVLLVIHHQYLGLLFSMIPGYYYFKRAGLSDVRLYDLRHTFATLCLT
jgi:integrase